MTGLVLLRSVWFVACAGLCVTVAASGGEIGLNGGYGFSADGRALERDGVSYLPIDDSGVFFYEGGRAVGCPMPDPRVDLKPMLERNGFHGVVRCRLVDFVDCTSDGHNFRESGGSRILKLGDDRYRVTTPAGKLGWFSYDLATNPKPGKPHLVVCQLVNDRERYTTVTCNQAEDTVWAAPYTGEEKYVPKNQEGATWRCDVGAAVYTGREYYCDGNSYTFAMLFYPKTDKAKITISHRADEVEFDELNGAAVARMWMFDVLDPLPEAVQDSTPKFNKTERKLALYVPHPWFLYSQFGIPPREEKWRRESLEEMVRYLKFCGFNQLQLHIIDGSDRASCAWYDSKLYDNLEGNLFKELLPIAEREGMEVVPIVAPIMTPFNKKPDEAPAEPDKNGWSKDSALLDKDGQDYTRAFGAPAPNPLRPEVQDWQLACFKEILERCAQSPAVPAVGFRVNGKIGLCFTGEQWNRCGQDGGYNDWMVEQFTKDTGIEVPKQEPTSYEYIKEHCWDEWLQWRCVKTREFWLRCRDFIRSYRSDLGFLAACDLPSETPAYNIEWPSGDYSIRDLFRHHGYDPDLFKNDEGLWIQRGMMVGSDRYWYSSWFPYEKNAYAHKMFNYAPGVAESYDVPDSSGVELYHNYWEEDPHPDPEYGPVMRTATPVAYKDFFYEPAVFSIRKVNVDRIAFMGWERACAGHEHDMRRFSRAYRAVPVAEPEEFTGKIEVLSNGPQVPVDKLPQGYVKPEMDVLWAKWFGGRLAVVNDAFCGHEVRVALDRPLKKGQALVEYGSGNIVYRASADGKPTLTLSLHPFDIQVLGVVDREPKPSTVPTPKEHQVEMRLSGTAGSTAVGTEATVNVTVINTAAAAVRDVIANVKAPQGWTEKAGDARTLASLASGGAHKFPVRLQADPSVAGKVGTLEVSVSYMASGGTATVRDSVPLYVDAPVKVSPESAVFTSAAGESTALGLTASNETSSVVDGRIELDLPGGWSLEDNPGLTLGVGETKVVALRVRVSDSASPQRYVIQARISAGAAPVREVPLTVDVALRCPRVSQAPSVDGRLGEWRADAAVVDSKLFRASEGAGIGTVQSLSPTAWLAWDDQRLYIAVHTSDTSFSNTFEDKDMWKGDSLQFGIDPFRLRSGPRGFFEYGFTAAEGGGARARLFRTTRDKEGAVADPADFAVTVDRTGTSYEAAVSWADLGVKPVSGDVIGVSLAINDLDGGKRRVVTFAGGLVETKDPTTFIALRLER